MTRKAIDCRAVPNDIGCTLAISGEPGELLTAAIGAQRTARWSVVGADRDRPGRYVAVVEFPGYAEAMANSGHPATAAFLKELQPVSSSEPQLRNLETHSVRTY